MAALILKIHFPPGTPFRTKLMKFKDPKDKTIKDTIEEIITTNQLGDPKDFLWYIPEKFENESFTPALWGKPEQTLDCFNLEQKAIIHLRKRQQANRVKHEKRIKMVLFDYVAPLEQSLPLVAKKFNYDNWREFNLYVSGEKEPLKLDQSLLSQGILPDTVFALRKPDEPVDQVMHPIKQRITISLNQQNQGGKKFMGAPGTPSTSHAQPSLPPPEEIIAAKTVKLNAAAKSFTKPIAKGYLIKQKDKGKWEKRYCVVESGHLFYYKTPNDAKPTGVLPLREYFLKEAKDEKKKSAGWDLLSVKEVIPPAERTVHSFKAETDKEKKEWMAILKKLTSPLPTGPGPKPSPPPLVKGKPAKLYGRPLEQAVANPDGSEIPAIVYKCIAYLDKEENVTREGIFRLSGSSNLIDKYVQRLDKGEDVDLSQELDPHAVAGLLKLYFRDLPEPLMTFELYPWFIASMSTQDRAVRLRYLKYLVEKLPPVNMGLLVYLLTFLLKISTFAEVNKMALHNLATVFAPNLLKSHQSNAIGMVTDTPKINAVINTLLQDYEYVFEDKEIDHSLTAEGKAAVCCRALYDYEAKSPDELSFKKGNIIKIIHEREDGWWIGEYKAGNFGRVPATYVQKLSDKQSQEFNKRQQFKQQMKRLTDEKEEQDREIQIMNEQRDELMREIEEIENNRNKLMAEFYHLKESLAPILTKTVTISDELDNQRLGGVVDATDDQELELESADAPPSSGGGKKDKKKEKKEKKAAKAEAEDETLTAGGQKLHVKRKLCRTPPKKKVWTIIGEGRLLEFEFQNDDLLDHPTFVTPYPYGDEDDDADEVAEAFASRGKKGQDRDSDE